MSSAARIRAPEIVGAGGFLNTREPLSLAQLRGRVVLLDFWTSACINCVHVLDELRELEERFGDDLVVVGVHSPKFDHEQDHEAVEAAVGRLGIRHPVLDDPRRETWRAYGVRAWPTLVLIDPEGYIALQVSGEGRAGQIAQATETLLAAHAATDTLDRERIALRPPTAVPLQTGLRYPGKVAWDPDSGRLAVADSGHHRVVVMDADGAVEHVIGVGHEGLADGPFHAAAFRRPQGMCFHEGLLWVADTGNHRLRKIDLSTEIVESIRAPLRSPWDVEPFGGVIVIAMAGTHQLWGYDSESGRVGVVAGSGREGIEDGPVRDAELAQPSGLAALGDLLGFVDSESSSLRVMVGSGEALSITTAVGSGLFEWGVRDGPGPLARFQHPLGLAAANGGWAVADTYNHRIRHYSLGTGEVTTLAGSESGFADGPAPTARFDEPSGAVDVNGALLIADTNNHVLRRLDMATGEVTTLVPSGLDPPGAFARPAEPARLAAEGEVSLIVGLRTPEGSVLDPSAGAPVRIRVRATPPELIVDEGDNASAVLPAWITLHTGTGVGSLRIDARAAFCDEGSEPGAACRLVEASWEVPVTFADGGEERLSLNG
jgi:thiol-disulfide isomerase/thioredoxin